MTDTDRTVTVQRSYKLRLYPSATQRRQLAVCFGHARFVWNLSLDAISFAYRTQGQRFTGTDCSRAITELKKDADYAWLRDCPATCLAQSLRQLDRAYRNFFEGRARYPRFKKKGGRQSATFQLDGRALMCVPGEWLQLPKLGRIKVRWSRVPQGVPKMATVSLSPSGEYHVSFMAEEPIERYPATGRTIGVDVGVKDVAVLSEGWRSGAPRATYRLARDLRHEQRALARKQKGSRRRERQKKKVARVHRRIANVRADFLHKTSTEIVRQADVIVLEKLNVAGMVRNRSLAKAITDAGLAELHRQLEYKALWHGRTVRRVNRWYPSTRTCSGCGALHDMPLSRRVMSCACGVEMDRDLNAAINLRAAGVSSVHVEGDTLCSAASAVGAASGDACRPGNLDTTAATAGASRDRRELQSRAIAGDKCPQGFPAHHLRPYPDLRSQPRNPFVL